MSLRDNQIYTLSVRQHHRFGRLSEEIHETGNLPDGNPILFIHGFNTNQYEAEWNYKNFAKEFANLGIPDFHCKRIAHFYWPGNNGFPGFIDRRKDWRKKSLLDIITGLTYSWQIKKAKAAATLLARHIMEKGTVSKPFVIVAHSLGCRLTLELLKHLADNHMNIANRVQFTTLMAGAVPEKMLEDITGPYHKLRSWQSPMACIFSKNDNTLKTYFPMGQKLARSRFVAGEQVKYKSAAIGYSGNPPAFWTGGQMESTIDHGEYWENPKVAAFLALKLSIPAKTILNINKLARTPNRYR